MRKTFDIFYDDNNSVYQIRTKNNCILIEFSSDDGEMESIFKTIIDLYDKQSFYSFNQLCKQLKNKFSYEKIYDVVGEMLDCGVLNNTNFEDSDNLFRTYDPMHKYAPNPVKLSELTIGMIGDPSLTSLLKNKLKDNGMSNIAILNSSHDISKQDIEKLIDNSDFIVFDQINYNPNMVNSFNKYALNKNKPWMLVEGPIDFSYYSIGPIFHGNITGCYNCYIKRILSNDQNRVYSASYIEYLQNNKYRAKPEVIPNLILDIISSIIILDVFKFLTSNGIPQTWRNVLLLNSVSYAVEKHYFLKAPACTICKPQLSYTQSVWQEKISIE